MFLLEKSAYEAQGCWSDPWFFFSQISIFRCGSPVPGVFYIAFTTAFIVLVARVKVGEPLWFGLPRGFVVRGHFRVVQCLGAQSQQNGSTLLQQNHNQLGADSWGDLFITRDLLNSKGSIIDHQKVWSTHFREGTTRILRCHHMVLLCTRYVCGDYLFRGDTWNSLDTIIFPATFFETKNTKRTPESPWADDCCAFGWVIVDFWWICISSSSASGPVDRACTENRHENISTKCRISWFFFQDGWKNTVSVIFSHEPDMFKISFTCGFLLEG